jgi:hypothetical protein
MFVRVAKFEGGDMERLREERPRLESEGPSSMRGFLMLSDPSENRRLFLSFYETREAAEEADRELDRLGDSIPEEIRGRRVSKAIYEAVESKIPAMV